MIYIILLLFTSLCFTEDFMLEDLNETLPVVQSLRDKESDEVEEEIVVAEEEKL